MWISPVFDRTSEDVLKVQSYETIGFKYLTDEQKAQWLSGLKGAWNYKDLNRIENDTKFLADIYGMKGINFKTDWTYTDIPNQSDIKRICDNIDKLRVYFKVAETTPKTPKLPINTHQKANDLEQILFDMFYFYENETHAFSRDHEVYKAELYSGEAVPEI